MMIGKINTNNYRLLIFLISITAVINSLYFNSFDILFIYLISLVSSLIFTNFGLQIIKKNNLLQSIREVGPKNHIKKEKTPTLGGVCFISAFLLVLLTLDISSPGIKVLFFLCTLGFLLIGLSDDILNIKRRVNLGLNAKEKLILQFIISSTFVFSMFQIGNIDSNIIFGENFTFDLNIFFVPLSILSIMALSNAVNLTDGLDGLAAGCSSIVFSGLGTEILITDNADSMIYSLICFSMAGVCAGFLKFNKYPAKIFMGDAGSLCIGGIIGFICITTGNFLTTFIMSGVFIIETLSVVIQVSYFKITKKIFGKGKRIFLMSPLHHHFELKGIHETKIVESFWKINIFLIFFSIVLKISFLQ